MKNSAPVGLSDSRRFYKFAVKKQAVGDRQLAWHRKVDADVCASILYVMQTKLTLRVDEEVIRKAKRLARKRGTSVSRIFSDYISESQDVPGLDEMGAITTSMIGVLQGSDEKGDRDAYHRHLEEKYL